jgi:tetratricopeptide (TPR) repeat protein
MDLSPSHPLSSYAAFQLGNLKVQNKSVVEAFHYYSIVLKGNISEFLGETYFSLGEVFYLQENYEKAFASFETALHYLKENSPVFFLTQLEMGNLQRRWDKNEEAKRSYRTILDHSADEDICSAARELLKRIEAPQ